MLKLFAVGCLGVFASIGGFGLNQYMIQQANAVESVASAEDKVLQVKTEMTGIPVIVEGAVSGYIVFQISSTIDSSKLLPPDLNVVPYILDAAIRASYQSTEDGLLKFDAVFIKKLADLIRVETNKKLNAEIVAAVNVEQFNFVPKNEIRGNVLSGSHQ